MAGLNGKVVPADFPPPVDATREFVKRELDGEDERIEIGVAIVGGGTAGLACANRLLQLLGEDPETMEKLGEVPVAVIEKAKTCGGHNLSGAVMRPGPLGELFPDLSREQWRQQGFAFGEVKKEAIYLLPNGKSKIRIPPPPPQRNHGNEVISVAALCRYMQSQAEKAGAYLLTETAATQLIVEGGAVVGVRSGDKGRGKEGEELGNFEPGTDIAAKATVLAEGCWGHLTDAAVREFELDEGREPQVWELGVKEVWKVKKPLDRVIHTLAGWPLKISAKYHQIGGSWIYPMVDEKTGEDLVSIGWVLDLDYADATTSSPDLLQPFKTHPAGPDILEARGPPGRRGVGGAGGGGALLRSPRPLGFPACPERIVFQYDACRAAPALRFRRALHPLESLLLAREQHRSGGRALLRDPRHRLDRPRTEAGAPRGAGSGGRGGGAGPPGYLSAGAPGG